MSDFFDKLKSCVVEGVTTVAEESGKLVERGKLKASILKLAEQRKDRISELGCAFYEMYKVDCIQPDRLRRVCLEIDELETLIEEKRTEEINLKGKDE